MESQSSDEPGAEPGDWAVLIDLPLLHASLQVLLQSAPPQHTAYPGRRRGAIVTLPVFQCMESNTIVLIMLLQASRIGGGDGEISEKRTTRNCLLFPQATPAHTWFTVWQSALQVVKA